MALSTGRTKLYKSFKTLRLHWEGVQEVWKDPVRQDFEQNFWDTLEPRTDSTLRATDRLDQILTQLLRDCS